MSETSILAFEEFTALPHVDQMEIYGNLMQMGEKTKDLIKENQQLSGKLKNADYRISLLQHKLFGRKSEKLQTVCANGFKQSVLPFKDQIFDEVPSNEEEPDFEESSDETTTSAVESLNLSSSDASQGLKKKKTGRKPLPGHLPREQVIHDLTDDQKQCACGCKMHKIGEEISEKLEVIPAQLKVIQHVRYKYSCKACQNGVKIAPVPLSPIPKSMSSPSLLAHVFIAKFDDHLPLYRQAEIWKRLGIDLNRATMSNWVIKMGDLCSPLIEALRGHIHHNSYVQADETPVTILKSSKKSCQKSYMWVYKTGSGEQPCLVYDFQESREAKHATEFLKGWQGYLQGDGYSGYNEVTSRPGVIRVGCMAHARRKFVDIVNMAPKKRGYAQTAVEKIKKFYEIESLIKEKNLNTTQVKQYREQYSKPLLDQFHKWLDDLKPKVPPKSSLGRAIAYTLSHWQELTRYLEDGRLAIDNNAVERAIKPFTVGRKNWLFVGNLAGAKGGAAIYSLIETAKANGLNPYKYLCHVLDMLPRLESNQITQLLPWNCHNELKAEFTLGEEEFCKEQALKQVA